jgi:hypothetical protein
VLGILSVVLGILIPFAGLALGILAWVFGQKDLARMRQQEMDPAGEGSTRTGWICGIVGVGLSCFCCAGYALLFSAK